jgi:2-(1,2-epoxy-1,2-dihydrophenyl)acetyl-CoA isomerase
METMNFEMILLKKEEAVGTVVLNRPKALNPVNQRTAREISAALEELKADENIRSVILTGAGKAFSAGGDIREIENFKPRETMKFRDFMLDIKKMILAVRNTPKPVITSVNGLAYGVGFSLALAGDIVLASEAASFCQVFVKIGLVPDGGSTFFLPRLIGFAQAFPLVFSGDPISAQEALGLGLISKVVAPEKLEEETMALAKKLARGPTRAMGLAKELMYGGMERTLMEQLDEEASVQSLCRLTGDHQEGLQAFHEKRTPEFEGR